MKIKKNGALLKCKVCREHNWAERNGVPVTEVTSITVNSSVLLVLWCLGGADGGLAVTDADKVLTEVVFVYGETRKKVEWSP